MFGNKEIKGKDCVYNCLKEECPKWVILTNSTKLENGETKNTSEGRCAIAWIPQLLIELRNKGI